MDYVYCHEHKYREHVSTHQTGSFGTGGSALGPKLNATGNAVLIFSVGFFPSGCVKCKHAVIFKKESLCSLFEVQVLPHKWRHAVLTSMMQKTCQNDVIRTL